MDLEIQARIIALVEEHGAENIVVVLGGAEAEASGLAAETVTVGDPTFAGPLAGVELGLAVYHVLDLKESFEEDVWEEQISMMEMILEVEEIMAEVKQFRDGGSKYNL